MPGLAATMTENKVLREFAVYLTIIAIIVSAVIYVADIRADLEAYIQADKEHQQACARERQHLKEDIHALQSQLENLYNLIYNRKFSYNDEN